MDDAKSILDRRLANGDVSIGEYREILSELGGGPVPPVQPLSTPLAQAPQLLVAVDDLAIFENGMFIGGQKIDLQRIAHISGDAYQFTLNFMLSSKLSRLTITLTDGACLNYSEDRTHRGDARHDAIRTAYAILRKATFSSRLDDLAQRIRSAGSLPIGIVDENPKKVVHLTVRGELVYRDQVVDLKQAKANDGLGIGVRSESLSGLNNKTDPDVIFASLHPKRMFRLPRKSIRFKAHGEDKDVVANLLQWLALPGNSL